jgi:hypothetical protein
MEVINNLISFSIVNTPILSKDAAFVKRLDGAGAKKQQSGGESWSM